MRFTRWLGALVVGTALLTQAQFARSTDLSMESWRSDDVGIWENLILPEFHRANPNIRVRFSGTDAKEYDGVIEQRLATRSAGDLVTCRPFDVAYKLYRKGYLQKLNGIAGLGVYRSLARQAWTTDDGLALFCQPLASVMHGFFYNKALFAQLGLKVPETEAEFFTALEVIKKSGLATPLAFGTKEQWESSQTVFTSIGPNRWGGEAGRVAVLNGTMKFTDPAFVETWKSMAKWAPYLPAGFTRIDNAQAREMFTSGRAAIYPSGSWDISLLVKNSGFEVGVFRPPVQKAGDRCYVSDHIDMGIGINAASVNKDEAETFLNWLSTKEFAQRFANALPGLFPLASHAVEYQDPLSKEMYRWRRACESTIRINSYVLNRGKPSMEQQLWQVSANVMNLTLSPRDAAQQIQSGLDKWFEPLN